MSFRKSLGWAVAVGALLVSTAARADQVSYITSGVFDSGDTAGTSQYTDTANGITVSYVSSGTQTAVFPANGSTLATFGQFDTSLTTNTSSNAQIVGNFTLSIFQVPPSPSGNTSFVGSLSGTLFVSNSGAFIQFNAPLTQTVGDFFYQIVSADDNNPGRVNLSPPTLNLGLSTIAGRVGVRSRGIPEPSTLILMGIGAPALVAIRYRKKNASVAV